MGKFNLINLKNIVEKTRLKKLSTYRRKYALAKQLGFSPAEANILMFKNEKTIRELAEEKNGKTNQRGA